MSAQVATAAQRKKPVDQIDRMLAVLSKAHKETNSKSRKKYLMDRIDFYLDKRSGI
jgi:hypothetical protein